MPPWLRRGASAPGDLLWTLREFVLLLGELIADAGLAGVNRYWLWRRR
jgi:hypothetical protein